jgi:NAD(P)-dependent dehydrogenase (short-subunit alcohol dehydrogenase family)
MEYAPVTGALCCYHAYKQMLPAKRPLILLLEVPFFYFVCTVLNWNGFAIAAAFIHLVWRYVRCTGADEPVEGSVFVTGCDSGMGETTAFHLAGVGYHVFAGCYLTESFAKYESLPNVTPIQIDVSDEKSVAAAAAAVKGAIENSKGAIKGLYGVLQCAGIAYIAPFEYVPMGAFKRQMDVNFYGYVYVAQAFLPLVKHDATRPGARRGRFVFVSSGPLPGPGVPFITSYLAAKWAMDAVCQGLRMEMRLRQLPVRSSSSCSSSGCYSSSSSCSSSISSCITCIATKFNHWTASAPPPPTHTHTHIHAPPLNLLASDTRPTPTACRRSTA